MGRIETLRRGTVLLFGNPSTVGFALVGALVGAIGMVFAWRSTGALLAVLGLDPISFAEAGLLIPFYGPVVVARFALLYLLARLAWTATAAAIAVVVGSRRRGAAADSRDALRAVFERRRPLAEAAVFPPYSGHLHDPDGALVVPAIALDESSLGAAERAVDGTGSVPLNATTVSTAAGCGLGLLVFAVGLAITGSEPPHVFVPFAVTGLVIGAAFVLGLSATAAARAACYADAVDGATGGRSASAGPSAEWGRGRP